MRKIYIILTYTGTVLSKIIKYYMGDEFSHVSIALDTELKEMYSFGRLNPYNPFNAGFIHECIDSGTFKRFKKTRAKVIELNVEESQYLKIKETIENMQIEKERFKFNIWGLFAVGLNIKIQPENSFYCAEFIKYLIEKSNIEIELPKLVRPDCFKKLDCGQEVYNGLLQNYNYKLKTVV